MESTSSESTQYGASDLKDQHSNPYHGFDAWRWIQQVSKDAKDGIQPSDDMFKKILMAWPNKELVLRWKKAGYNMEVFSSYPDHSALSRPIHTPPVSADNIKAENDQKEEIFENKNTIWEPNDTQFARELSATLYPIGFLFEMKSSDFGYFSTIQNDEEITLSEPPEGIIIPIKESNDIPSEKEIMEIEADSDNQSQSLSEFNLPLFLFTWNLPVTQSNDSIENRMMDTNSNTTVYETKIEKVTSTMDRAELGLALNPGESYTEWLLRIQNSTSTAKELGFPKPLREGQETEHAKKLKKIAKKAKKQQKKEKKAMKKAAKKAEDITGDTPESVLSILQESIKFSPSVVTETYADLMVSQGYIDKAKEMYNELMLRNPEKSSYFAAKIKELN